MSGIRTNFAIWNSIVALHTLVIVSSVHVIPGSTRKTMGFVACEAVQRKL